MEQELIPATGLTVETLKSYLPKGSSTVVTQEIIDTINKAEAACGIDQELIEDQVISYTHLLGPVLVSILC